MRTQSIIFLGLAVSALACALVFGLVGCAAEHRYGTPADREVRDPETSPGSRRQNAPPAAAPVVPLQEAKLAAMHSPPGAHVAAADREFNTEAYDRLVDNAFLAVADRPLSTFSIDVDTASYANVRRFIRSGTLPPPGAVRIEEMINYFRYSYAPPSDGAPFAVHTETADCPWNDAHRLVRIGLKGREIRNEHRPPSNFVFLLDVSGSMRSARKLPLVIEGMKMLVDQLGEDDRVAIAVYAGASGLVLPSTSCEDKSEIKAALSRLRAGGSTNGGQGIQLAYRIAGENFIPGGVNRVILCTDGDFNVGVTNRSELVRLIEKKAKTGVFLTVLGFGTGNLKDSMMEKLADKGNGNYGYIDTAAEARKVLVEQLSGTLVTIAKDVKIQVEFNPAKVKAYRLIGYENRLLRKEDFNDDTKDAGEIGAGHTVTALYEVVPVGAPTETPKVDELRYQPARPAPAELAADGEHKDELMLLKLRYKQPDGQTSKRVSFPISDDRIPLAKASDDFRFAASVAAFGMILRDSPHKGDADLETVIDTARSAIGDGTDVTYRKEFVDLATKAGRLLAAK